MGVLGFGDIIGHAEVMERLSRDLQGGRLAHAYLFVGPEGVGRAAAAVAFGAATLCKSPAPDGGPCADCISCGKIDRRNHPDFFMVRPETGKRWIRIDQVRELQGSLAMGAFESDRRAVIVDGAEHMNESAQNAFLKTLEEPPPGVLIVMVAPGVHTLLPTIVSRCRIERFGPLTLDELAPILMDRRGLDQDEARLVAGLAGGSVGAAMSMDMEYVKRVRPALLERVAGLAIDDRVDPERVFGLANQLVSLGDGSLPLIRSILADAASLKTGRRRLVNADMAETARRLGDGFSLDGILKIFDMTIEAEKGLSRNLQKTFLFENLLFSIAEGKTQ